jgi:hypothetical protein
MGFYAAFLFKRYKINGCKAAAANTYIFSVGKVFFNLPVTKVGTGRNLSLG